ncbi:hypothetical protein BGZ95_010184 [Linnemannia exigua]|uniref:Uncharacterized protein n=1 Tax=Linnemannia exigua TaxID=604196 RepID=A0AAD4H664_9FUNG|nr:hypothetical protein BGZ95_010184 [Linnemannia exigua]
MGDNVWDWPRFRKYVQSLSLPLKWFHYSIQLMRSIDEGQEEEIYAVCPNAKERTLSLHGLTPKVFKSLTTQPAVLTTLEILLNDNALCQGDGWKQDFRDFGPRYTARPLHHLLCEGSTLRHLKTLKMPYLVDFMDLHRRYTNYITHDEMQGLSTLNVPGIWSCRGLTGMCLLSRLNCLERLRLDFSQVPREGSELTWLCPSGRTPRKVLQRLSGITEWWVRMLKDEAALEAKRLERISAGANMAIIGEGAEDVELMDSLKNLGLLLDVKIMVEKMNDIDFVCLPELRLLACGRHLEQSPEKEMRSVFYVKPGQPPGFLSMLSFLNPF